MSASLLLLVGHRLRSDATENRQGIHSLDGNLRPFATTCQTTAFLTYTMAEEALRRAKAIAAKWNQSNGQGNDGVGLAGTALGKRKLDPLIWAIAAHPINARIILQEIPRRSSFL